MSRAAPIPDKDRNALPALLTMPDGAVAGTLDFPAGKLLVRRLEFLQTDDIRLRFGQPPQLRSHSGSGHFRPSW
ncbi:hypothetical protein GGQ73_003324 [Rhizobium skierniewicense]|uniref:Uncharacterized protein n=1 Tax=Rhizobium skierniewicense TaxID=984260 RepID=A0A7W6CCK8_9HYPH|nr:hypothetical protein [Rhizobium skierniewicense]UVY99457.1 hypothetical protein K4M20_00184 [Agrobacterium fabrum]CAD0217305.1 hypothetical protein AGTUEHA105_LOCUS5231 [Agrobacterium tumefaciens]